jgi:hypothetical protein
LEKLDTKNAFIAEPSRTQLLLLLNSDKIIAPSAESLYQWLTSRSLQEHQTMPDGKKGSITIVNLWEMLSSLELIGRRIGLSIGSSIQKEELLLVVGKIPENNGASLLVEELLAIIFAKLANVKPRITRTKNSATVRIPLK